MKVVAMTPDKEDEAFRASEEPRPTPTVEDYLGVIYVLTRDGQPVIGRKLAEWMEVSPPTVTATVQRMVRDGWVTMAEDKSIHLTEAGRGAAASVVRRHMLTELLLARVLGVPWSRVHEEAHKLEHDLTPETTARVAEVVSDSTVCPHGNPLPGYEAVTAGLIPLLDAEPGQRYILARVHEEIERDAHLMAFLEEHGLVPGAEVEIVRLQSLGETISVRTAGRDVALGLSVAAHMWVAQADDPAFR
jgi:DtxR family transcriptional regulator, Mn-dependent transcriptional regulator